MKCPKHENCCIVSPHRHCIPNREGKDVRRWVTCHKCFHKQLTDSEICENCKYEPLPWPENWKEMNGTFRGVVIRPKPVLPEVEYSANTVTKRELELLMTAVEHYEESRWFNGAEGSPERIEAVGQHYKDCLTLRLLVKSLLEDEK